MLEKTRVIAAVAMVVLMLGLASLPVWAADGPAREPAAAQFISHSGDDAYDPAAGGAPALSVGTFEARSNVAAASSFGGDDAYDPAASASAEPGAVSASKRSAVAERSLPVFASTFGGDDDYDPAACGPSGDDVANATSMAVTGGYGGDDDYDPAAGGKPEFTKLTYTALASCGPVTLGN